MSNFDKDVLNGLSELRKSKKPGKQKSLRVDRSMEIDLPFIPMTLEEVIGATRISRSKLYYITDPASEYYCPDFPKPIRWAGRSVMWKRNEIIDWMNSRQRTTSILSD